MRREERILYNAFGRTEPVVVARNPSSFTGNATIRGTSRENDSGENPREEINYAKIIERMKRGMFFALDCGGRVCADTLLPACEILTGMERFRRLISEIL